MFEKGDGRYFGLRGTHLNIAIGVLAGLDFLLFGYNQGVMGGLLTLPAFTKVFPEIDTTTKGLQGLSKSQANHKSIIQGISVGSYNVGCFFGAISCIWVGDRLGRRRTIFLGSAIMVIGAILQCTSFTLAHFIVGRLVTGYGNGLNTSTVPTWQSECSKSHRRGQLVMVEGALITGGVRISYWLDFGCSFINNQASWRFPIAFQIVFALTIMAFILELPESPRWLILKGKENEAMSVLGALSDLPPDDHYVHIEFTAIKDTVLEMQQGGFDDLFTMDENRHFHRVVLAYVNQVFQQISGINLITYYAATIYQNEIGLSPFMSRIPAACNGTEYFLASWIAVFIIEKIGRRKLMLFGAAGQSASMVILAVMTKIGGTTPGIVAAAFLFIFNTFFAVGWLGMTWLYPAEIVPLRIRAPANAVSTSANWAFNFMVVMITPVSFSSIGYKTYIIFAVINAFIFPVVYFFYPETAYRSLEEMDSIFQKTKNIFTVVWTAKNEPRRYGKHGEILIDYEETEEHLRRSSLASQRRASMGYLEKTPSGGMPRMGNGYTTHQESKVVTELASKLFNPKVEYKPKVVATDKRIRGILGGKVVFDTTEAKLVWEHKFFPQYWIPRKDFTSNASFADDKPISGIESSTAKLTAGNKTVDALLVPESFNHELAGLVKIDFKAMDQWLEEMSQVVYHPKDPFHRVDVLPSGRHVKIEIDGVVLADTGSEGGVMSLWETNFPGRWYLPRTAVNWEYLTPSETHTGCPYKGEASYYNAVVNGKEYKDVVWWYKNPILESTMIIGMLCFYPDKVDMWIDGKKAEKIGMPFQKPVEPPKEKDKHDQTNGYGKSCNC